MAIDNWTGGLSSDLTGAFGIPLGQAMGVAPFPQGEMQQRQWRPSILPPPIGMPMPGALLGGPIGMLPLIGEPLRADLAPNGPSLIRRTWTRFNRWMSRPSGKGFIVATAE